MMKRNILITIEYDGSAFHGWQIQPEARTVQGELEKALSRVCGERVSLNGTSRTDAGVHALGQAASFTGDFGIPADRVPIAANDLLDDVRILTATEVPEDFHARFDAKGKTYLYRIAIGARPDIFLRNYRYLLNDCPNKGKMEVAARCITGTRDFAAFRSAGGAGSAKGEGSADTVRTITDIDIAEKDAADTKGEGIREMDIRVTGDGFMYNMVRIIVGTLVETGLGARSPESAADIIESRDRRNAGHTAPAAGLYLEQVYFESLLTPEEVMAQAGQERNAGAAHARGETV
jgi:tRNA pseudouridine38-40 synthase